MSRLSNRLRFTATLLASLWALPAAAQTIHGTVVDSIRSIPLRGVAVDLLSREGVVSSMSTDTSGQFEAKVPAPGAYRIRARRIGYRDFLTLPIAVGSRDTTLKVFLPSLPVALVGMDITTSSAAYLDNVGFFERKKSDPGYFMPPEAVFKAASKARQTADVLDGIPGVSMGVTGGSFGIRVPVFAQQMGCDAGPNIYVDGHLVNGPSSSFDLNNIAPVELLALEIYRHVSEIPLKFGGTNSTCGVLAIWTKH